MRLDTALSLVSVFAPLALARPWTPSDECPTTIRTRISSNPCAFDPKSLQCTTGKPRFTSMDVVHAALSHCPNITGLDLRVTTTGCTEIPDRWDFPLNPAGGEKYPPLKSLRLEGYDFGTPIPDRFDREAWMFPIPYYWNINFSKDLYWWVPDGTWCGQVATWFWEGHWKTWMQLRAQPRKQKEKTNLGLWLDAMDWSSIEELAFIGETEITDEMIEKLPSRLHSLKMLETTKTSFINALDNNTLTHFKWVGSSKAGSLLWLLEQQGDSLQSLEFRCEELWCSEFARSSDIAILSNMTRNLTHLTTNVPRNGTWPLESLQAIASLPHLQSADLYFHIQSDCARQREDMASDMNRNFKQEYGYDYCKGEDQFQQPFVDKAAADELFAHMQECNSGGQLKNVTFWIGDWKRPWDGALWIPPWADERRSKVVCGTEAKTKEYGWCVVEEGETYWQRRYGGPEYEDEDEDEELDW